MAKEYWVVGGSYRDVSFTTLDEGAGELYGPFGSYGDAVSRWREVAATSRPRATVRYSVVVTAAGRPAGEHAVEEGAFARIS